MFDPNPTGIPPDNVACGSVTYILAMSGNERDVRNLLLLAAAMTLAVGVLLIPGRGAVGASISIAVTMVIQNLVGVVRSF